MFEMLKLSLCLWMAGLAALAGSVSYSYDAVGRLARVDFPNGKSIVYTYDPAGNMLSRVVFDNSSGATPAISANGVDNAASFVSGAVAPGEMISIFGTGIGPQSAAGEVISDATFSKLVADTAVLFDGEPAAVVFVSALQTSVLVPYSVAGKTTTQLQVIFQGRASNAISLPVAASAPGVFTANASGKGNGAILNQNGSSNSPTNPAKKGSTIVLFATGEGQTNPPGVDGKIAGAVLPKPLLPVSATIGGANAVVQYAGAAPGLVAGVVQVNVVVPTNIASGAQLLILKVGSASSQAAVTVSVQ